MVLVISMCLVSILSLHYQTEKSDHYLFAQRLANHFSQAQLVLESVDKALVNTFTQNSHILNLSELASRVSQLQDALLAVQNIEFEANSSANDERELNRSLLSNLHYPVLIDSVAEMKQRIQDSANANQLLVLSYQISRQLQVDLNYLDGYLQLQQLAFQKSINQSYQQGLIIFVSGLLIVLLLLFYQHKQHAKVLLIQRDLDVKFASQVLSSDQDKQQLLSEIQRYKDHHQQLTSSKRAADEAHQKAKQIGNLDSLTQLVNRKFYLEQLNVALQNAEQTGNRVAILYLDLNRFKNVNDTLGHFIGDQLLIESAQRIKSVLRGADVASRFGGDEFVLFIDQVTNLDVVQSIVNRIVACLAQPFLLSGNNVLVSASIGISVFPEDGGDSQTLLSKADSAMYKAKQKPDTYFQFFTQQMDREAKQRRQLESLMRSAVKAADFKIAIAPIVNVQKNCVIGLEASIDCDDFGCAMQDKQDFQRIAEETGLVIPIGNWLLDTVSLEMPGWLNGFEAGAEPIIAIRVSRRQLLCVDMASLIANKLLIAKLAAKHLMVEITESTAMDSNTHILDQLHKISALGVKLAIANFGANHCSFSYLKRHPISTVKIAPSVVASIGEESQTDKLLLKGILSMATSIGLSVIAQGVENSQQIDFLQQHGCQVMQGDYFEEAMAAHITQEPVPAQV